VQRKRPRVTGLVLGVLALALAMGTLAGFASPAQAAPGTTFVVTSTADRVDANPGDGLCRTDADTCTLRAAIMEANASPGDDTIQLGSGTHSLGLSSLNEDDPETGDHDIQETVAIVGAGTASVIDGGPPDPNAPGSPGMDRLLEIHPTTKTVILRDLTLQEGYSAEDGGAIMNWSSGLLRLERVTLRRNLASGAGGAIANGDAVDYPWPVPDPSHAFLPGGRVEVVASTLRNNGAGAGGAALFNQSDGHVVISDGSQVVDNPGEMVPDPQDPTGMVPAAGVFEPSSSALTNAGEHAGLGSIRITGSTVARNWSETSGGGVANEGDGTLTVERSTIADNTSLAEGGGVFTHGGTVTVRDGSVISDNHAAEGGGLSADGASTANGLRARVTVSGSDVVGNVAEASGGGILSGGDGHLVLTDSLVSGNRAADAGGGLNHGGRASLEMVRTTVRDNEAHGEGGGAYVGGERLATISGSMFTGNDAGTPEPPEPGEVPDPSSVNIAGGGALYTENGPVEIRGSTFTGNTSTDEGGAISLDNHGDVTLSNSTISQNRAGTDGGGIENSGTRVLFDHLTISDNRAALDGGGIHNSSSGEFTIRATTVRVNSAVSGGGLANAPDNKLRVVDSLFHRNTARQPSRNDSGEVEEGGRGGGIWSMADGDTHIENTTISGNTAAVGGGGVFHDADGEIKLSHVTVWRNSAPLGGAIGVVESDFVPEVPPKPNVSVISRNSIVGGSLDGGSCDYFITSEGGNLDTGSSCFISVLDSDSGPTDIRDRRGDPSLDAIADNGGPTLTHMPRYGSLAIDAGASPCPEFDQRGVSRPQNGKCDTGAVEFEGPPPAADDVDPDTEYVAGPVQDSFETVAFEFTGSDDQTVTAELQFECRLIEIDVTEEPEPTAPWDPVDPEQAWKQCTSPWSVPLVEEGLFTFEVRAIDRAGNVDPTPAFHHFDGTDQVPPNTIIEMGPTSPTSSRSATFTFTGTDNITPPQFMEYECRLDSLDPDLWLECFNPAIFSNLTSGQHTLEVRAYDGNENVDPTPARYTWTVGIGSDGPVNCDTANIALTPTADAWVDQVNPGENYLFETELTVRSDALGDPTADPPEPVVGQNARALVRFPLPGDGGECDLERAVLKLYADSQTEGRTLVVRPLDGTFRESTVTWANQPGVLAAEGATAPSGIGYREFDVTAHVQDMLSGDLPNNGWSIRDAAESQPGGGDQAFASRETPQDPPEQTLPVLELTYAADAAPPPPPPSEDLEPTQVTCGQVIRRSTLVTNDLSCPIGEGLVIGARDIVLDLGGHTIDGPDYLLENVGGQEEGFPAGIRNSGYTNVVIRNGTVKEMGYGVLLTSGTTRNVVENLTVRRNAMSGIELFDADDGRNGNVVRHNTVVDNELGISLLAGAQNSAVIGNVIGGNLGEQVLVQFSSGHLFEDNTIHGVPTDPNLDSDGGVLLEGSGGNTIRGGEIRDTGDAGVVINAGSNGNTVEGTKMYRNGDAGVIIIDSDRTRVSDVTSHQQSDGGVVVSNGHDTVVEDSDLQWNPSGVESSNSNDLLLSGNDASHSLQAGFEVGSGVGIRILDNTANHTGGAGISLESGVFDANGNPVGGALIEGNTTNENAESGVSVADGGHQVVDNDAHNNAGFGLTIGESPEVPGDPWPHTNLAPPDVDGAMNRASGNGEDTQCSGLLCDETGSVPVGDGDTVAPETVLLSGPTPVTPALPSATASTSATFTFTGTDNRTAPTALRFECRLDAPPDPAPEPEEPPTEPPEPGQTENPEIPEGLHWHECISPMTYHGLEQGPHTFEVRAVDQAPDLWDLTPAKHEWTIDASVAEEGTGPDSQAPDTRIATGPTGTVQTDSATFTFTGSDNSTPGSNLAFSCRLDGGDWAPCLSPVSYSGLAVGQHTFEVAATDRATPTPNTDPTPASRTWTVEAAPTDTTAPDTELLTGPDHVTTLRTASFTFRSEDPTATFECQLDGGAWTACTSPRELTGLATGQEHTFLVRAVDPAGNADPEPAGRTWFVGTAPTPGIVVCGMTVTTSIVVRNNLVDCEWDALRIGADNITIDLDGHTIDGKGIAAAIRNDGFDNVTVKNGTLTDFDYGVMLNPGTRANIVEDLDIQNNQEAGVALGAVPHPTSPTLPYPDPAPPSFQSNVIGNIVRDNRIDANAVGVWVTNKTTDTTVLRNTLASNAEEGVWLERSSNTSVQLNDVSGSSGHAVLLQGANGNTILENDLSENGGGVLLGLTDTGTVGLQSNNNRVEKNTILESGEAGVQIEGSDGNQVLQNVAKFSNGDGIELYQAEDNVLKDNDVRANKGGLSLTSSSRNRIEGNDASESEGTGISLEASSFSNVLLNNTSSNNDGDGIYVGDETPADGGMWLEGNRTHNNKGYGIYVSKVSHTLKANIANDNGGWGIWASAGSNGRTNTDAGGNKAQGNMGPLDPITLKPLQCFSVVCDGSATTSPDPIAPDTRILEGPADPSSDTLQTFRFTGTDNQAVEDYQCSLDGAEWAPCTSPVTYTRQQLIDLTGRALGDHTFATRAVDTAGNIDLSPATHEWEVVTEVVADAAVTITVAPDPTTVATTARFEFTTNGAGTVECSLDGAAYSTCTSPRAYQSLAVGDHTFRVRFTNASGQPAVAEHAWTITSAPVAGQVSCGQIITRSTVLTNDLTNCPGNGLVVGASNITIDLDGHTIDGTGIESGVLTNGFDNVTIRNGAVHEFDFGVHVGPGSGGTVVDVMHAELNQEAGVALSDADADGVGATVRNSTFVGNAVGIGLYANTRNAVIHDNAVGGSSGEGIRVENAVAARVHDNEVARSSGAGILVLGGGQHDIRRNELTDNQTGVVVGEELLGSDNTTVAGNTVRGGSGGVLVEDSSGVAILDNVVRSTLGPAVALSLSSQSLVRANDLGGNSDGITLEETTGVRIEANDVSGSLGGGIEIGVASYDNVVTGNTANDNGSDGIMVDDGAPTGRPNVIRNNTADGNGSDGIHLAGPGHVLQDNSASMNGGWGMYAAAGVTDNGGNYAAGNAEPEQCFNVTCTIGAVVGAPETWFESTPPLVSGSRDASFTYNGSDDVNAVHELVFECRIDSTDPLAWEDCEYPAEFRNLSPGSHTVQVRAVDLGQLADPTPATYTWTYEPLPAGVAPEVTLDLVPPTETWLPEAVFTFHANEPNATFECRIDDLPYEPCGFEGVSDPARGAYEAAVEETQVGPHTFYVRAIDFEGNVGEPTTYTWTLLGVQTIFTGGPGFTPPEAPGEPATGGPTTDTSATISFVANVADAGFSCSFDLEPFEPCTSPFTVTGLTAGDHELRVVATADGLTEMEASVYEWEVVDTGDAVPPDTSIELAPANSTSSTAFEFVGTDNATPTEQLLYQCRLDSTSELDWIDCTSPFNLLTEWTYADPQLSPGQHTFEVRAIDAADPAVSDPSLPEFEGNVDPTPATHTWTMTADSTPPGTGIGTGLPATLGQATEASVTFFGTDNATPVAMLAFECSVDSAPFEACTSPVDVTGLAPGAHDLRVRTVDLAGNRDLTPATEVWTVVDAPTATITSGPAGQVVDGEQSLPLSTSENAVFTFTANQAGATFECSLDGSPFTRCTSPRAYWVVQNGTHEFEVRSVNAEGVVQDPATRYQWTVELGPDATNPDTTILTGPAAVTQTDVATFTFTGTDNRTAAAQLTFECALDGTAYNSCTSPEEFSDLTRGTHVLLVRARDAAGNFDTVPARYEWTVDHPPVTTILSGPDQVTSAFTATFTFAADVPGATYQCWFDGLLEPCTSPKNYTGIGAGPHLFAVLATSPGGLVEEQWAEHEWTVGETVAPITDLTVRPGLEHERTEPATFEFTTSSTGTTFECWLDGADPAPCESPVSFESLSTGEHTFNVQAVHDPGVGPDGEPLELLYTPVPTSYTFTVVDTAPPDTVIRYGPATSTTSPNAWFGFASSESGSRIECSLDGGGWSECEPPHLVEDLAPGDHTLRARAVDVSGQPDPTPAEHAWTITVTGTNTPVGNDVRVDVPMPGGGTASMTFFEVSTAGSTTLGGLTGGPSLPVGYGGGRFLDLHTTAGYGDPVRLCLPYEPAAYEGSSARVLAFDGTVWSDVTLTNDPAAGRVCAQPEELGLLALARSTGAFPLASITAGPTNPSSSSTATFTFTVDQPGALALCSIDQLPYEICTSPHTYTHLEEGGHTFSVQAVGENGPIPGYVPSVYEWEIVLSADTAPPDTTITSGPGELTGSHVNLFEFAGTDDRTASADLEFQCWIDGEDLGGCSTPEEVEVLTDGEHVFEVAAIDDFGNVDPTPARHTFTVVDVTAPETSIDTGPADETTETSATFTFSGEEPNGDPVSQFECALDLADFAPCTTPYTVENLESGGHVLWVRAKDDRGVVDPTPEMYEWLVLGDSDGSAPDTTIVTHPGQVSGPDALFAFASDEVVSGFECRLDGAAWESCETAHEVLGLDSGEHTLEVRALDLAVPPNVDPTPASHTWTAVGEPETTITTHPAELSAGYSATFEFTSDQPDATFLCSVDGSQPTPCTSPYVAGPLTQDTHTFEVQARNGFRYLDGEPVLDQTPATFEWTVQDVEPPQTTIASVVRLGPTDLENPNTLRLELTGTDNGTAWFDLGFECSLDGGAWSGCDLPYHYVPLEGLATGDHTIAVRAVDDFDNTDPTPAEHTFSVEGEPETTLLDGPAAESDSTTATFTFSTDGPAGTTYECSLDGQPYAACDNPATFTDVPFGEHELLVRAVTPGGVTDQSEATYSWTTGDLSTLTVTVDSAPPAETADTTATVAFTIDNPTASARCSLDGAPLAPCESPATFENLDTGAHTLEISAVMPHHLGDVVPGVVEWTVLDVAAPVATLTATPATRLALGTEATFEFTSNEPGADFECSLDGAAFEGCDSPLPLSGLGAGDHTFSVRAVDASLNAGPATEPFAFTVVGPPTTDVTAAPADGSTTTDRTATFEFAAGQAGSTYRCALDGAPLASCESPVTYADLGFGLHVFTVEATNDLGLVEDPPTTVTWTVEQVTTGPAPDTTITLGPDALTTSTGATLEFTADQADATFECRLDAGAFEPCTPPHTWTGLAEGPHTALVRATSTDGAVEDPPAEYTWTVDLAPDTFLDSAPAASTLETTATFELRSDDPLAEFECSLDTTLADATWGSCPRQPEFTGLATGPHVLHARAVDEAGNADPSPVTHEWTVEDAVDTTISADFPHTTTASGDVVTESRDASFAFSSNRAGATFECAVGEAADAGAFSDCGGSTLTLEDLALGEQVLLVRAVDAAGNRDQTPAEFEWEIGTIPAEVTVTEAPPASSESRDATFAFSAPGATAYECRLDGGTWSGCTSPETFTALSFGAHTFDVRVLDPDALVDAPVTTRSWSVVKSALPETSFDLEPPATTGVGTSENPVRFSFGSNEAAATFECALDTAGFAPCESPVELTGLDLGDHTFEVRAVDVAGQPDPTPSTHTWRVVAEPATSILSGPSTTEPSGATVTFEFSADAPGATFACSLDAENAWQPCPATHEVTGLTDGEHTLRVRATADGVVDQTPEEWTWTTALVPETTIASGPAARSTEATASFRFSSSEPDVAYLCALDGGPVEPCAEVSDLVHHQVTVVPGSHRLDVVAEDADGNRDATPAGYEWTVLPVPETTLDSAPEAETQHPDATFAFSSAADNTFECRLDDGQYEACGSPKQYTALAVGTHTFTVRAADGDGNVDPTPVSHTWRITEPTETAPPETTLAQKPPAVTDATTATFELASDELGTYECNLDGAGWQACDAVSQYADLAPGEHTFAGRATDQAGNTDPTPVEWTWRIGSAPDTTIDGAPENSERTSAELTFSSTATGATFQCRLDGAPWSACASPEQYADLTVGDHTFAVRATDADGLTDPTPATHTWTVRERAVPDTTITAQPEAQTTQTSAELRFEASEQGSTFECRLDGDSWQGCTSPKAYTDLTVGEHTFAVRATDGDGNTDGSPASYTWTVQSAADTTPPQTIIGSGPADPTTSTTANVAFSGDDGGGGGLTFSCRFDLGAWQPCTSPVSYGGLAAGLHTVEVRATDAAANTDPTPAVHQWFVVAPVAPACGTVQTLTSNADAWFDQKSPSDNKGTDSTLKVQSKSGSSNFRAAVRFPAVTVPAGCVVQSATLRMWNDAPKNGRTIQALRLGATWAETGITWANQPATLGAAATVPSGSTKGWREWNVTTHVVDMLLASAQHGFLIRDAVENQGSSEQQFFSREKSSERPQLVVRFTAAPPDTAAPDTTITAGPSGSTADRAATFGYSSGEPGVGFECSLDEGPYVPCPASGKTYVDLSPGHHSFAVRARDAAGNPDPTPARREWDIT
jgi:CSLREA domain-containing protein